jgi:ubiquinone/menaquinone biosynthesis C-methylase UbiE
MSVQEAYSQWAATYDADRNLTRDLDGRVTRETLATWPGRSILEIGCGTGKNTTFLAQIGRHVHALDFTDEMIRQAQAKVTTGNVAFSIADLTKPWPRAAASADLVICNLVLEHIEGLPFIFAEAARCLLAGGRFFICELHPFRQYQGTKANFQRGDGRTEIDAFTHHISDYIEAANANGLSLLSLKEWWHEEDGGKPPRVVSFVFKK